MLVPAVILSSAVWVALEIGRLFIVVFFTALLSSASPIKRRSLVVGVAVADRSASSSCELGHFLVCCQEIAEVRELIKLADHEAMMLKARGRGLRLQ